MGGIPMTPRDQPEEDEDLLGLTNEFDVLDPSLHLGLNRPQIARKVLRQRLKKLREENTQLK
jgi:hypothetical protein